jgi:uncharacterized protein HemY
VAKIALKNKDFAKAEKFLKKSLNLSKSREAQNLIYKLDTLKRKADQPDKVPKQHKRSEPDP